MTVNLNDHVLIDLNLIIACVSAGKLVVSEED